MTNFTSTSNFAKNILIVFFFLTCGIAAQAQTETAEVKKEESSVVVKNNEVKKEDKTATTEETIAFSFNHKQFMKPVTRKSAYC